jgi:hypothetical protein
MRPKHRFAFTVDIWDDVADDIIKRVASVGNFEAACLIYEETVKRWPTARIILRQGARTVRDSGRDR